VTPGYDYHMGSFSVLAREGSSDRYAAVADPRRCAVADGIRQENWCSTVRSSKQHSGFPFEGGKSRCVLFLKVALRATALQEMGKTHDS
jgi:hypothetical protein